MTGRQDEAECGLVPIAYAVRRHARGGVWSGIWNLGGVLVRAAGWGIITLLPVELILQVGSSTWAFGIPNSSRSSPLHSTCTSEAGGVCQRFSAGKTRLSCVPGLLCQRMSAATCCARPEINFIPVPAVFRWLSPRPVSERTRRACPRSG